MNLNSGRPMIDQEFILAREQMRNDTSSDIEFQRGMANIRRVSTHPITGQRVSQKVGRNEICPCGSGRKFKRCCLIATRVTGDVDG